MQRWRGYMIWQWFPANLSEANWDKLIVNIDAVQSNSPLSHDWLRKRVSVDGNYVLYRCDFPENAVSFERIKSWLVAVFDVDPALVTFTTGKTTLLARPSVFATYRYNGENRVRVGLFGCENATTLCTLEESKLEAVQYIDEMNAANWHEVESLV